MWFDCWPTQVLNIAESRLMNLSEMEQKISNETTKLTTLMSLHQERISAIVSKAEEESKEILDEETKKSPEF